MKSIKVVVTGGAGFIGSHLVDALVERGLDVHVVDDLSAGKKEWVNTGAELHVLDIADMQSLLPIFQGARCVFHLAARPQVQGSIDDPIGTHQVNVNGTVSVLEAARSAGVERLVFTSSGSVYGDQKTMPLREDMPVAPKSPYALHKAIGEMYCRTWGVTYGMKTVSLRYSNVYGPRSEPGGAYALVVAKFLKQRADGVPLTVTGDGKQTRDYVHVRDVARANIMAMESEMVGAGEVINIGSGRGASVNEIAAMIGGPITYIPARFEPRDAVMDISVAERALGWLPDVPTEVGIAELLSGGVK